MIETDLDRLAERVESVGLRVKSVRGITEIRYDLRFHMYPEQFVREIVKNSRLIAES